MTKLEAFVHKNFMLSESDLIHVPAILAEIQAEIDEGHYDDDGLGRISEYTLCEVFDDKLYKRLQSLKSLVLST